MSTIAFFRGLRFNQVADIQLTSKETQGYVACVRKLQPECYHVEFIP